MSPGFGFIFTTAAFTDRLATGSQFSGCGHDSENAVGHADDDGDFGDYDADKNRCWSRIRSEIGCSAAQS